MTTKTTYLNGTKLTIPFVRGDVIEHNGERGTVIRVQRGLVYAIMHKLTPKRRRRLAAMLPDEVVMHNAETVV